MSALRKGFVRVTAASVLGMSLVLAAGSAKADGLVSFDAGGNHYCFGVLSCLFKPEPNGGRDADNMIDHRKNIRDHREVTERKNTIVIVKPQIRDHRTKLTIRDHRN